MVTEKSPRKESPKNRHLVTAAWIPVDSCVLRVLLELQPAYGMGAIVYNGATPGYSLKCKGRKSDIEKFITWAAAKLRKELAEENKP